MSLNPNFSVFDTVVGSRTLNAAAIAAILENNPSALTVAALAAVLAAPGTIGGTTPGAGNFAGVTNSGASNETPTTVAAAGSTVADATAIGASASVVKVTVTASTEGVKLPVITTAMIGDEKTVLADPSVGNKVYAGTGNKIGAATTNTTAFVLAKTTVAKFYAADLTHWRVFKGA